MECATHRFFTFLLTLGLLFSVPVAEASKSQSCTYETLSGMETIDSYMDWFMELAVAHAQYQDADSGFTERMMQGQAETLVNECSSFYERLRDGEEPWSGSREKRILKLALDQTDLDLDSIFRDTRRWARELQK
jgi:hypothetical protein